MTQGEGMTQGGFAGLTRTLGKALYSHRASVAVEVGTDLLKIFQVWEGRKKVKQRLLKVARIADLKRPIHEELPLLLESLDIRTRRVVTYLPRKLVTMRFLEVPSTDEREVADIIRLQGIKQTPYSREEVALAHAIVGSRNEGMSDVVLAFCQRKFVDERVDLLERSGLKVEKVGIGSEGVVDWYIGEQVDHDLLVSKDLVILIDQDLGFSDVVFCRDGKFIYSKNILAGAQQVAMDPEGGVAGFCDEVIKSIEFAQEEIRLEQPKKAVLIASLEEGNSLRGALEAKLQLPVEFFNPGSHLDLEAASCGTALATARDGSQAASSVEGVSVTPLIGFGRGKEGLLFDLMPEDRKLRISLEKRSGQMVKTGALSLIFLTVLGLFVAGIFYKKRVYLKELEREIDKTQEYAASIEEKSVRTRLMEKVKNPETSFLFYLKKVSEALAPGAYFNSIDFSAEDSLTLKGYAGQMSEVFEFAKTLEGLKVFKGVKSDRVSKKKEGDQVVAEFEINCVL